MKKKQNERTLESYTTRQMRLSDEVWEKLKAKKIKSGKSWNLFIGDYMRNLK